VGQAAGWWERVKFTQALSNLAFCILKALFSSRDIAKTPLDRKLRKIVVPP